jgi:putative membrane protein
MSEKDNGDLAKDRTDWAEDRTLMANERTFAGWRRTGLASVGLGLGFHALFGKLEPWWIPRLIATIFIIIGVFIFYQAQKNGCNVQERMAAHKSEPIDTGNLRLIAGLMSAASTMLGVGMWLINLPSE